MRSRALIVDVHVAPGQLRRWHVHVIEQASLLPHVAVRVVTTDAVAHEAAGLDLLFDLERLLSRSAGETSVDRVAQIPLAVSSHTGVPDLILDLTGSSAPVDSGPAAVLVPRCLELPPLTGVIAALLDDAMPVLSLDLEGAGTTHRLGAWPVAIEDRRNSLRASSMAMGRLANLILCTLRAMSGADDIRSPCLPQASPVNPLRLPKPGGASFVRLLATTVVSRISARLTKMAGQRAQWGVGLRLRDPETPDHAPEDDATAFFVLPDDGSRFYADPFPFAFDNRCFVFVEEYPYATGKGLISLCEIDSSGRPSPVRPILEQDCHLSYPHVFAQGGQIWMIPETGERRTIELWRADPFPDRWTLHQVLLTDVEAYDATVAEIDGLWWMFAATRERWCSTWDAMTVWTAPDLAGPWQRLDPDPALVDVRRARPAGRVFKGPDGWLRPVQTSVHRYGEAMALARLDCRPDRYCESIVKRWTIAPPYGGIHTWNQARTPSGLLETIDFHGDTKGAMKRVDLRVRNDTPTSALYVSA